MTATGVPARSQVAVGGLRRQCRAHTKFQSRGEDMITDQLPHQEGTQGPILATSTQTLKLESGLLIRLKIHAAITSRTQQDVMYDALVEYLDRHEVNAVPTMTRTLMVF